MELVEKRRGASGRVFRMRREVIAARAPAVLELPVPGSSEEECVWRRIARDALLSSRVRPFAGRVEVSLTFRDSRRAQVIGDLPNACLQLLVGTRIIASADSPVLRRLTLSWGAVEGVRIEIRAVEGGRVMKADGARAPGHDGNAPEFRAARDLAGSGKRSAVQGLQNINTDRLEWLLAHRHIDVTQHGAGRKLQRDREMSVIGGYAMSPAFSASAAGGAAGRHSAPADIKCDAIRRMNAARAHVRKTGFRILELIVLENVAVAEAARRLGEPVAKLPLALRVALDLLASFYRLA